MAKKEQPELLKLLNARAAWNLPTFRQPRFSTEQLSKIEAAVALHAEAYKSDPFAASRVRCHLLRGLDSADEVADDARNKIGIRQISEMHRAA